MILIGETLRTLRRKAGLTQKQVAQRLSDELGPITNQAVSKWETDDALPSVRQFLVLCRLYGVWDVPGTFTPCADGPALNAEGRQKLREYEELLLASGRYTTRPLPARPAFPRLLPLYDLPASAGTGQFLDGEGYELVAVDDTVPPSADFGVRLAGDSMEPRFADGQIVWVQGGQHLENGEIGLFLYEGEAYCKQLAAGPGGVQLVSLNPRYAPVKVTQTGSLRVFGRVVG